VAVWEEGLVVEAGVVFDSDVESESGVDADEAAVADESGADMEETVLDAIAKDLGIGADGGVVADVKEVKGGEECRVEGAVGADLGAKEAEEEGEKRSAGEGGGAAGSEEPGEEPEAEVKEAPEGIGAGTKATDENPLGGDTEEEGNGPSGKEDAKGKEEEAREGELAEEASATEEEIKDDGESGETIQEIGREGLQSRGGFGETWREGGKDGAARGEGREGLGEGGVGLGLGSQSEVSGELLNRREAIGVADGDVEGGFLAQEGDHLSGEEGVTAEVEKEVLIDRDLREVEDAAKDGGDLALQV
jgi:hypothetical protein